MARRGTTASSRASAQQQQQQQEKEREEEQLSSPPPQEDVEMTGAVQVETDGGVSRTDESLVSESEENGGGHSVGESSLSAGTTGSSAGSGVSSSSSESEKGIKPSEAELVQDTTRLKGETMSLKISLAEDKLALIEKRMVDIEKGIKCVFVIHSLMNLVGQDEEFNAKLEKAKKAQEQKLAVSRERLRLAQQSAEIEYTASVEQAAKEEIMLVQEAKHRVKVDHHTTVPLGERTSAGHEFPLHVEHTLSAEQIAADLQRIGAGLSASKEESKVVVERDAVPRSTLRKHSLKDDFMGGGGGEAEAPMDADDNPQRLSKIRRKSR